jgi:SAM-dependent methyltransferase
LESEQPLRELSVVSKLMSVFRRLRAALGPTVDGVQALEAFLCFLACADDQATLNNLDLSKWSLPASAKGAANDINENTWSVLLNEAITGERRLGLRTNFDLLLRHASGQLFQEAHYHAIFDLSGQLQLVGFPPSPIRPTRTTEYKGLHFTPPSLARSIVEEALAALEAFGTLSERQLTIFDPACGSGEFLREALRLLRLKSFVGKVRLIGWDISAAACSTSRFVLAWEARNFPGSVEFEIIAQDSLSVDVWPTVDLVLMNPPFVSWEDMGKSEREKVIDTLASASSRPDMASAFLRKATMSLRLNGVIGTVLPASILTSKSALNLRAELSEKLSLRIIARLGSQQLFSDTMVDPAFIIGVNNEERSAGEIALWADHRPESASASLRALRRMRQDDPGTDVLIDGDGFSIYRSPTLGQGSENWAPRRYKAWRLLEQTSRLPRVGDLFNVRQGIRTGANDVFLLTNEQWVSLPAKERKFFRAAIVNSSIRKNFLTISMYVFYPFGRFKIDEEAYLEKSLPHYYSQYLKPARDKLIKRPGIREWWELTRHRSWQVEEEPKLVSTYFGDNDSFAVDVEGSTVVLQGYAWFPKSSIVKLPDAMEGFSLACLALLASSPTSILLSAVSNHVGGGQWDLSTRFVERLPMPDLLSDEISADIYKGLVSLGDMLSKKTEVDRKLLDDLAIAAYGVSEFQ